MKDDVVVRRMLRSLVMIAANLVAAAAAKDVKRAGHAEMHHQNLAG